MKVITRCTRPENLFRIHKSLPKNINWVVLFDTSKLKNVDTSILEFIEKPNVEYYFWKGTKGDYGHGLVNKYIKQNPNHYYYILDDDTIMHPNLKTLIEGGEFKCKCSKQPIIIGDQYVGGKDFTGLNIRKGSPENMRVQHVDMGQFIIWGELWNQIGGLMFMEYKADGYLLEKLHKEHPNKFRFLNTIISYYNYEN